MSWSPDLFIGELRPWPDSVRVVHGNSGESRRYTPERKDSQEALERRIDELCAEVEKYRSARDASVDLATKTIDRINELEAEVEHGKAENAKLRELVRIAVMYCDSGTCDGCPIQGESGSCPYSDMARELGIEVQE